jgi:leucyl aminopeptidase
VKLIPAQRDVRITQKRGVLAERSAERSLLGQDAVIVACDPERAIAALATLPNAPLWERLYRDARVRGPVSLLVSRISKDGMPFVVVFSKPSASAFERLSLAGRAWREIAPLTRGKLLLGSVGLDDTHAAAMDEALLAAVLAGSARMPTMKSKPLPASALDTITLLREGTPLDVARSVAVDHGNHLARCLTMLPPNVLDTPNYRRALRTLAQRERWAFTFYDEAALKRLGAGAFLAVSRANEHRSAGIARLRYRPAGRGKTVPRLALVGKGICFDTGGINLKPHKSMYHMHEDMQGSAVALGTLLALSELRVPFEIDCWLAITENEIGAQAYRPQEVVRAANGVTIQVAHSDAEGRMVLADTLALAAREQPDMILDFATLTGACVTALTERYSGAFTNHVEWRTAIELAGRHSGERVWNFPMDEDFDSDLDSPIADILQCTPDSKGDHILAARFLNRFVPAEIPWIHLDLAASNRSGGLAHIGTDFTGFGVRYATHLLLDHDLLSTRRKKPGTKKTAPLKS